MLAVLQCPKQKCTEKRKKAIRKLKLPLNQHASGQPSTFVSGRASLVKRTLGGPFGRTIHKKEKI
jgi:hypothetical protein